MSFIVEDGHGISDANSYVSVRFADDFLAYRTDFDWSTRTTDQKQAALVQATAYVDARYGRLFAGRVATSTQALAWPRQGSGYDGLPVVLKRAVALYAAYAAVSPLAPAPAGRPHLRHHLAARGRAGCRLRQRLPGRRPGRLS